MSAQLTLALPLPAASNSVVINARCSLRSEADQRVVVVGGLLKRRWQDLFGAQFEVLLYGLTSTYFEAAPPHSEADKRRYGYSRDKRGDCVQVVIALVVTPEGFPLAYEVMAGNTVDNTTLRGFLARIEAQYGKARRIWVMDRGIPTEAVLAEMRQADPSIHYLVGTPIRRGAAAFPPCSSGELS